MSDQYLDENGKWVEAKPIEFYYGFIGKILDKILKIFKNKNHKSDVIK